MKKMNLNFFGFKAKIVLPLFLLIGLFLMSANPAQAEFVPKDEAIGILKGQIVAVQDVGLSLNYDKDMMLTPEQSANDLAFYKHQYAKYTLYLIQKQGMEVEAAIDYAVETAEAKGLPEDAIEAVRDDFVDLLTKD